jgi:two-component system phosphate regulon response regulator OmpR
MNSPAASLLLVEDDDVLAPLVVRHLEESGFSITWAPDAEAAWKHLESHSVDLAILDIMLPGEDGLSLCRRVRKHYAATAIIMVTARGEEADRIRGLDLGADDYLPKPLSLWELEARIKAVLRRSGAKPATIPDGPLQIDAAQRTASFNGQALDLTRTEFDLLAKFAAEPGRVFSRDLLLDCVKGGESDAFDRAIDTHISNLRKKIGDDPKSPAHLKTVWGVGYRFELS